jgi:hypothetical protein
MKNELEILTAPPLPVAAGAALPATAIAAATGPARKADQLRAHSTVG